MILFFIRIVNCLQQNYYRQCHGDTTTTTNKGYGPDGQYQSCLLLSRKVKVFNILGYSNISHPDNRAL